MKIAEITNEIDVKNETHIGPFALLLLFGTIIVSVHVDVGAFLALGRRISGRFTLLGSLIWCFRGLGRCVGCIVVDTALRPLIARLILRRFVSCSHSGWQIVSKYFVICAI